MHIITSPDPGPWLNWMKRPENARLNLSEARSKYNKEQMLFNEQQNAYIATQVFAQQQAALQADMAPNAGFVPNEINRVEFIQVPPLKALTANTGSIIVGFTHPTSVNISGGVPTLTVNNDQDGGGSVASFTYDYKKGSGTRSLVFEHIHGSFPNNNGGYAASDLETDEEYVSAITTQPTATTADTYVNETMVWAQGTGGTGGANITATIVVGDLQIVDSIIVTDNDGGVFSPGNTLTLAGSNLGGSGNLVVTIRTQDLQGDRISIPTQTIALNGGVITTGGPSSGTQTQDAIRRQGLVPYTKLNAVPITTTVVAE